MSKPSKKTKKPSKMAMRVLLAKDVLAQLETRKLKAKTGIYVGLPKTANDMLGFDEYGPPAVEADQVQKIVQKAPCEVCAQGGLLVAYLRRFDGMNNFEFNFQCDALGYKATDSVLAKYFPGTMLQDMERVFEFGHLGDLPFVGRQPAGKAATDRLKAMMANLIRTGGKSIMGGKLKLIEP